MNDRDRASTLHRELKEARRAQRKADYRVAVLLAEMEAGKHFHELGYPTLADYAREELELDKRRSEELSRVGRSLASLPALDAALADGRLEMTKARELLRVVRPETEAAWVARVEKLTNREIERLVRSVPKGAPPPDDVPPAGLGPHRQRFVTDAESTDVDLILAAVCAVQALARSAGEELDDGAALAVLARYWLDRHETDDDPVVSTAYKIVIHAEPNGELRNRDNEVSQTTAEMALCDAEIVDMGHGPTRGHVTRTVPPARREAVLARDDRRCVVPGCRCRSWLEVHHLHAWAWGGTHEEGNLVTLCRFHHGMIHEGTFALERLPDGRWRATYPHGAVRVGPPPRVPSPRTGEAQTPPPYGVDAPWRTAMDTRDG